MTAPARTVVIEPGTASKRYWRDLWNCRELLLILAWRDVSVRYKQTAIGFAWAILRPFLTMVVFTVVFGRLAGLPADGGAPYALMVLAAMLPWTLFSTVLGEASGSLVGNAALVGKVYFPRMLIPLASTGAALADFLVGTLLMAGLMAWYGYAPGPNVVFLPLFVLMALAASIGPGLWMTALNVKYRDFRYVVPFIVQMGLYVSPVGFSSAVVPERWRLLYGLNPMVGVIDGFRWCILGGENPAGSPGFLLSLAVVALLLLAGVRHFRAAERSFADLI